MLSRDHFLLRSRLGITYGLLCLAIIFLVVVLAKPSWRQQVRGWVRGDDRKIVATLKDDLKGSGEMILVFKIKEAGSLFLEFYSQNIEDSSGSKSSAMELLQRLEIPNAMDGFVSFMGETTNLAVANLDGDPLLELIVPSYNFEFASNLDVIKYNAALQKFEVLSSFELPANLLRSLQREAE